MHTHDTNSDAFQKHRPTVGHSDSMRRISPKLGRRLAVIGAQLGVAALAFANPRSLGGQALDSTVFTALGATQMTRHVGVWPVDWSRTGATLIERSGQGEAVVWSLYDATRGTLVPFVDLSTCRRIARALHARADADAVRRQTACDTGQLPFAETVRFAAGDSLMIVSAKDVKLVIHRATGRIEQLKNASTPFTTDGFAGNTHLLESDDMRTVVFARHWDLYAAATTGAWTCRLTSGGTASRRNGVSDWIYQEEFNQPSAVWWAPDSRWIAYLTLDERKVRTAPVAPDVDSSDARAHYYPPPGGALPRAALTLADTRTGKRVPVQVPDDESGYLLAPLWTGRGHELAFQWLNRRQNELTLLVADPNTGRSRQILQEYDSTYVNAPRHPLFIRSGREFLWLSERDGTWRIYRYSVHTKNPPVPVLLTASIPGPVTTIDGVDERTDWVYFTVATNAGLDRQAFRVRLSGGDAVPVTTTSGTHEVYFAPSGEYFLDYWSSRDSAPTVTLRSVSHHGAEHLGSTLTPGVDRWALSSPESLTVTAADGRTPLHAWLFHPYNFNLRKSYPLLLYVYGGPHIQTVRNAYVRDGTAERLAQRGFVVLQVDNRGTPARGRDFERATFLKLGQTDLADQIAAVSDVVAHHSYIDPRRIGIYGSSYGGYLALMAATRAPDVFTVAVAVAPVVDWRLYDAAYTERYMETPQANPAGYSAGTASDGVAKMRAHVLLVFGTADPNVHPIHSFQFLKATIRQGKHVDVMVYPNMGHGAVGATATHLTETCVEYLARYLGGPRLMPVQNDLAGQQP